VADIHQTIGRIFDAYLQDISQFEETVALLESYYLTLSPEARTEFFDILWQKFSSARISHLTGKRTPHEVIIRAWAAFGPAETLPAHLFATLDWKDSGQMIAWAVKIGGEFVHSLFSYRHRFSKPALDQVKENAALIASEKSRELAGASFPAQLIEVAQRLTTAVDKINFEDFQQGIVGPKTPQDSRRGKNASRPAKVQVQKYGRWKIIKSLPEGGQAHVFLVEDVRQEFKGNWVLKRLKNIDDPTRRARFQRETKVIQSINHPNVLKVIDSDLTGHRPYFVTEYCEQGSLLDTGASNFRGNLKTAARILLQIVDGLVVVHNTGPIHRDLKPGNILIRKDGTPVIGDFGICFVQDGEHITLSDEGVGSKNFMAPEMESGQRDLGGPTDRTDVYCLGKVIYWMLSGGVEFSREDHRKSSLVKLLQDQKFEHVHQLLDEMVVREPEKRIRSGELKERLEMTASLVEGNYAPLSPSIGIRCRFCGIGQYTPLRNKPGYTIPEVGLNLTAGTDVRVLWCRHCGHIEMFQFNGIENRAWWDK
jgi:hypothetical protein